MQNETDNPNLNILVKKLKLPSHIDYIARYILKKSTEETRQILEELINERVVEESIYAKDYYNLISGQYTGRNKKWAK